MNLRPKKAYYLFIVIIVTVLGRFIWLSLEANMIYQTRFAGDWITFGCSPAGEIIASGIFLIRPDGSDLQQITPNSVVASMPTWSPDGYWIAFVNNGSLFKIHPDGSSIQPIMSAYYPFPNEDTDILPDWSPDGNYIAFVGFRISTFTWDVYRINENGSDLKRLSFNLNAQRSVDWSPDGKWVTFAGSTENGRTGIYMMQADGGNPELLTSPNQSADDHSWSPDGQKIVFFTQTSGNLSLSLIGISDRHIEQITRINGAATYPEWSPDGQWIVFSMATSTSSIYQLYKIRLDGTELTRITNGNCNALAPSWFRFSQP